MSHPLSTSPKAAERPLCRVCGGNGVLRISHQRFRTCLDCLGLGLLPIYDSHPALNRLLERKANESWIEPLQPAEHTFNAEVASVSSR